MPFGDRIGPWGLGPMTGHPAQGYMNPVPGRGLGRRGFGRRRGGGRGFGWGPPPWGAPYGSYTPAYGPAYAPSYSPEDDVTALKDQAKYFEEALQDIKKRIEEIESSAEKD